MNKVFKAIAIALVIAYLVFNIIGQIAAGLGGETLALSLCIVGILVCAYLIWATYTRAEEIRKRFVGLYKNKPIKNFSSRFDWLYAAAPPSWAALPTLIIGRANFIWGELVMVYSYIALFIWTMIFAFSMI
jgi:hypothetical protein